MTKYVVAVSMALFIMSCGDNESTRFPGGPGREVTYHETEQKPSLDLNRREDYVTHTNVDTSSNRNTNNSQALPPKAMPDTVSTNGHAH